MKRVIVGLVLVGALAATAWFAWAAVTQQAVTGWLDERAEAGWVVNREDVSVEGFPARFVTVLTDLELADPATGWAWSVPELTLSQEVLNPGRIEAVYPPSQTLASPFERLEITSETLISDLDVQPANNLALNASTTTMRDVQIASTEGWQTTLAAGDLQMTLIDGTDATYDIGFEATDLTPPDDVARLLDPAGLLPEAIPVVRSAAVVAFERPWDLSAIETARPQITRLDLEEARAEWGELLFRASGTLDVDPLGRATGEVAVRAENWREMLDMAERAGMLGEGMRNTVESAIGFLAGMSGRPENLEATLRLEEGFMYFGPLPIGEAPLLVIR